MRRIVPPAIVIVTLVFLSCARYEHKPLPFVMPVDLPNATDMFGATVAARSFTDPAAAREMFGFDILSAKVLPVQVIFDHKGDHPIRIVPGQTFLKDRDGKLWNIMDQQVVYQRIEKVTDWGEVMPGAGRGAVLGAAAGAIIGAAIGIVSGDSVSESLGKGAAIGAAGGAVAGGAQGLDDGDVRYSIRDDLRRRSLENKPIEPQGISQRLLFFPGEAHGADRLRLHVVDETTGERISVDLLF